MQEAFHNPINPEKVTDQPGLLPYAHTAGGAVIRVDDLSEIRNKNLAAMKEGVGRQIRQLHDQIEVLMKQAQKIQERRIISERVYQAHLNYEPVIGQVYYLYEKDTGQDIISIISPEEWGYKRYKYSRYIAKIKLLADNTWDVESNTGVID